MPIENPIKAVFFDLDGTLLDSAPDFYVSMRQLMDEYKQPHISDSDIRSTVSDGARALITLAFNLSPGDEGFDERLQRLLAIYTQQMGRNCKLFPKMERVISYINREKLYWGIITNKPSRFTDPIMSRLILPAQPNLVICPDHVSKTKPDAEPLLLACNKVGLEPKDVVYVGDHKRDIDCGINAGCRTIAVKYGYLKPDDDIASWNATHIAHTADDIWLYVLKNTSQAALGNTI